MIGYVTPGTSDLPRRDRLYAGYLPDLDGNELIVLFAG